MQGELTEVEATANNAYVLRTRKNTGRRQRESSDEDGRIDASMESRSMVTQKGMRKRSRTSVNSGDNILSYTGTNSGTFHSGASPLSCASEVPIDDPLDTPLSSHSAHSKVSLITSDSSRAKSGEYSLSTPCTRSTSTRSSLTSEEIAMVSSAAMLVDTPQTDRLNSKEVSSKKGEIEKDSLLQMYELKLSDRLSSFLAPVIAKTSSWSEKSSRGSLAPSSTLLQYMHEMNHLRHKNTAFTPYKVVHEFACDKCDRVIKRDEAFVVDTHNPSSDRMCLLCFQLLARFVLSNAKVATVG